MKKSILLGVDGSSGGGKALWHVLATIDPDTVGIVLTYVIEWSPYSFNTPEENAERHKRRESEISRAKAGDDPPAQKPDQNHRHHRCRQRRACDAFRRAVHRHDDGKHRLACRHREDGKVGAAKNDEGKPQPRNGLRGECWQVPHEIVC